MSQLRVYAEDNATEAEEFNTFEEIREKLTEVGVQFERWQATQQVDDSASQDEILDAYKESVDKLMGERGFQTADVISITPQVENHSELRKKFLNEHTHSDDEARFFIDGKGLFTIHANQQVYSMLCEKNDLINVPAGTKHWFDMGPNPYFKCIRVFTNQEGWVAKFTGDNISERFPRLEN